MKLIKHVERSQVRSDIKGLAAVVVAAAMLAAMAFTLYGVATTAGPVVEKSATQTFLQQLEPYHEGIVENTTLEVFGKVRIDGKHGHFVIDPDADAPITYVRQ